MNRVNVIVAAVALAAAGTSAASAQTRLPVKSIDLRPASLVPNSGYFVGLGGSFNNVAYGDQSIYAVGTSNVFLNGVQTSAGSAAGPATIGMSSDNRLAPALQAGYFQRFADSDWLWGAKFSYSYLGSSSTVKNALLPQAGSFTPTGAPTATPFTGNALVRAYQTKIDHQIAFVPFAGRAFDRSFVYAGVGPTLSRTRTNLNQLIGFADLTGTPSDVSGLPINLSGSGWVFGGAAVIGGTYFLDRSWFLDFSYSYAMTAKQTFNYFSPFANPNGTNGTVIVGTLIGNSAASITTQAITLSLNRSFDYK